MGVDARIVSQRVRPDVYPVRIRIAGLDRVGKQPVPEFDENILDQACLAAVLGAVPEPERQGEPFRIIHGSRGHEQNVDPVSGSIGGPVRRTRNDVPVYELRNRTSVTRHTHLGFR